MHTPSRLQAQELAAEMNDRTLGQIIDGLGIELDLEDDQAITDAVIIAKVLDMETGELTLETRWSPTISWMERIGMLRITEQEEHRRVLDVEDDE